MSSILEHCQEEAEHEQEDDLVEVEPGCVANDEQPTFDVIAANDKDDLVVEEKAALSSLEEAISSVETDTALLDSIETETQDFEQEAVKKNSIVNIVDLSSAADQLEQFEVQEEALISEKVSDRNFMHKII